MSDQGSHFCSQLEENGLMLEGEGEWRLQKWRTEEEAFFRLSVRGKTRQISCPLKDWEAAWDVLRGYEYPMADPLVELSRGLPVADIGAHAGAANAYFDALLDPPKIVSVEPDPRNLTYLNRNASATTEVIPAAATDHGRGAELNYAEQGFVSSIYACSDVLCNSVEVPTIHGWDVLERTGEEIGLLKIDAECSEANILMSAEAELDRCRLIYLEYHSDTLRRQVDALLRQFLVVYSRGRKSQGVMCYMHRRCNDQVPHFF